MAPSSSSRTLGPAEVEALFSGRSEAPSAPQAPSRDPAPWSARYDRCACCRVLQPALLTFSGETDWSPSFPTDGQLRVEIATLRFALGRRTILLCAPCIEALSETTTSVTVTDSAPRLFED